MKKLSVVLAAAVSVMMISPAQAMKRTNGGVLDPSQFKGLTRQAYAAAAANPGLAQKLFCYCGCDKEAHHKALLDCYTSDHAIYCMTCKDEMVRAAMYQHQGMPMGNIMRKIDYEFRSSYPFSKQSAALQNYKAREGGTKAIASSKKAPKTNKKM